MRKQPLFFPEEPKIYLGNYFPLLDSKIRVKGISLELKEIINQNYGNQTEAGFALQMSKFTLQKYIYGGSVPIKFVTNLTSNIYFLFSKNIWFTAKQKKIYLPKFLTPKLPYFIGYLQGD